MDLNTLVSANLDSKLKCSSCKNYLSYFPIHLCSNKENICGRCNSIQSGDAVAIQNEALEVVCQWMKFPCRYMSKGCRKELLPGDMPHHENNCLYKGMSCAIKNPQACDWKGSASKLVGHYRDQHSDIILKNGEFQIDFSTSGEWDNLLEHGGLLYHIFTKFDSKTVSFYGFIGSLPCEDTVPFVARIGFRNRDRTLILHMKSESGTEISLACLRDETDRKGTVTIKVTNGNEECVDEECNAKRRKLNDEVLAILKCSSCHRTISPPILKDISSCQLYCSSCSDKLDYRDRQNIKTASSNEIVKLFVTYECKYKTKGCTFMGKALNLEKHQVVCEYGITTCECYVDCPTQLTSLKDLLFHISQKHANSVWDFAKHLEKDLTVTYSITLLKFADQYFRLTYAKDGLFNQDGLFKWSVQQIGNYGRKFNYEIDVFGTDNSARHLLRQECGRFTPKEYVFSKYDNFCYLEKKQIENLNVSGNPNQLVVKFKVRIF